MNSRAPARMALTMTCGWLRPPMANTAESGNSWRRSSTARMAVAGLSAGTSTKTTSGVAACTRRKTRSERGGGMIGRNIHQDNVGSSGLHAPDDWIGCCDRETGAGMNRAGYAGSIHQHLEHGALLIIGGHDDD